MHVCVRRDDAYLVDVTGAHTEEEFMLTRPGVTIRPIGRASVLELSGSAGRAAPADRTALAWVDPVLRRATQPAELPAAAGATIRWTSGVIDGIQIRVDWSGDRYIEVHVCRAAACGEQWVPYGWIQLPRDSSSGKFIVDFTVERLTKLVERWLPRFDRSKAEHTLGQASGPVTDRRRRFGE